MESHAARMRGPRTFSVIGRLVILVAAAIISQGNGCSNLLSPTKTTKTGAMQCADIGALYCNSYSVPQTLTDAPGTCCVVGNAPNAGVGYLCAFGSNKQAAGCVSTLELARDICPSAVSIVRCTR